MKVTIKATPLGGTVLHEGDRLIAAGETAHRYACAQSGVFQNGAEVEVIPIGDAPDLLGGEALRWEDPRPGCAREATATKPLTHADFDRLEKKVDDLTARFEKLLRDNAVRLVTDGAPRERTFTLHLRPATEMLDALARIGEAAEAPREWLCEVIGVESDGRERVRFTNPDGCVVGHAIRPAKTTGAPS